MSDIEKHKKCGVIFTDEKTVYIDDDVEIGHGTVIEPCVCLRGKTKIGDNCKIGFCSEITDSVIGSNTLVRHSVITESRVGNNTSVGPFAHLRPGSHIGSGVKIGDFVEIKNSNIGDGTMISHLTYVGDADVGENVNFGCGTITVNYDGTKKSRTVVEDDAFIGCNTNLVAPVKIGKGAFTAAGSTITEDVPECSLAIARQRQTVKHNWALNRKEDK